MKKNLNIAYLNGAEGMIKRGGASSGGSVDSGESGSGSGDEHVIYYKCDNGSTHINDFMGLGACMANMRSDGPSNRPDYKMYHPLTVAGVSHGSLSQSVYIDAFALMPIKTYISNQGGWFISHSYEEFRELNPNIPPATRITAEEYWSGFNAE